MANELRKLLAQPGSDPALEVDADLRPEGKQGPLVRTLDSYAAYYDKWSAVWEAQALLRAEAVVGDRELCGKFIELIDPLRWPRDGLTDQQVREIRTLKARMEAERLPRGADPKSHFKLGRGGLSDVEWTVQLLQMRHAHNSPGLRTTRTLPALRAAVEEGFVEAEDAQMRDLYRLFAETVEASARDDKRFETLLQKRAENCNRLRRKYEQAARHPWLRVLPDPPPE